MVPAGAGGKRRRSSDVGRPEHDRDGAGVYRRDDPGRTAGDGALDVSLRKSWADPGPDGGDLRRAVDLAR
jgi:hypothetical protein